MDRFISQKLETSKLQLKASEEKQETAALANGSIRPVSLSASVHEKESSVNKISLEWNSPRNLEACSCSTPFDHYSVKVKALLVCFVGFVSHSYCSQRMFTGQAPYESSDKSES